MTANVASRYFTMAEMACHDEARTPYPTIWVDRLIELFAALDIIREAWGGPLKVVSGYRTLAYNAKVGGAGASQHTEGRAVDLRPIKKDLTFSDITKLAAIVDRLIAERRLPAIGGVGVYPLHRGPNGVLGPGWVHVDCRPKPVSGHIARWEGEKVGDERTA